MIKIAIIGIGAIAGSHIEGYLAFPEKCQIVALVDKNIDKANAKLQEYQLKETKIFSEIEELLNSELKVDLVSICLPPAAHCQVSVQLLEQGIHVLCEKPLAPTLEECDRMIEAAKKGNAQLSTVAQNRFKTDVMKVKKLVDSGIIGKTYFAKVSSLWWRGTNYYNLHWRGKWETEGGGCTMIHGIHHIDLFLWLMGEVESVISIVSNQAHTNSEVEDISMTMVKFTDGALGNVVCSILHHGEEQTLILDGEKGSVGLPLKLSSNIQRENGFPEDNTAVLQEMQEFCDSIELEYTGHTAQIKDVLEAIEENRPVMINGIDGRRAIEFITAAYQSAFTGQTVNLPLGKDDLFYTQEGILKGAVKFYEKTVSVESFQDDSIQVGGTL